MSTIIVGHDGSRTSDAAVLEAVRLAEALRARLHVVMAVKETAPIRIRGEDGGFTVGGLDGAEQILADAATRYGGNIEITTAVVAGDPDDALVAEAERLDAAMIVVGSRRTQGPSRLLGSVASGVVRKAPCSVHIAHTTG